MKGFFGFSIAVQHLYKTERLNQRCFIFIMTTVAILVEQSYLAIDLGCLPFNGEIFETSDANCTLFSKLI